MRCFVCDATVDGRYTAVPFKKSRSFSRPEDKPWLDVCSDCSYVSYTSSEVLEDGEIENLESDFDD